MPLFEVTLSDGGTSIMQAHNKTQLKAALANVTLTKIEQRRRCKQCYKAAATVESTLCEPCWREALDFVRGECSDIPISEEELKSLTMSFFVGG